MDEIKKKNNKNNTLFFGDAQILNMRLADVDPRRC